MQAGSSVGYYGCRRQTDVIAVYLTSAKSVQIGVLQQNAQYVD
ncbi:MAG: hypothetical protein ACI4MI_04010 [Christensenellales bacterium]